MSDFVLQTDYNASDKTLTVSCIDGWRRKFVQVISDFKACQTPKALLSDEGCVHVITNKFRQGGGFQIAGSSESNVINVTITYMPGYAINLVLNKCVSIYDLESKIIKLEKRINELEHDEIVHEHVYPTWDSLDEFKELPGFKYMEAAEYPDNWKGQFPYSLGIGSDSGVNTNYQIKFGSGPWGGSKMQDCPRYSYLSDKDLLETEDKSNEDVPYRYFPKSVKSILLPNGSINEWVCRYISRYVYGWILINHKLIADRTTWVEIVYDFGDLTIYIKRSKKRFQLADNCLMFSNLIDEILVDGRSNAYIVGDNIPTLFS